jgi:glutathione synthase/RimK-type ligase-like ATP-grasp enzyme
VFAMCQGPEALSRLRHWEERGHRVVNPPDAIEGCRRRSLLAAFERSGVRHPQSVLVDTGEGTRPPAWVDGGAWVKRGDVHATEAGDVVHAAERGAVEAALASLSRRGIETALVQRHVAGAVIKFYAVRGRFLCCFAGDGTPDTTLGSNAEAALGALAEQAAHSIGLEVFGGDCVLDREQSLWLIDLNDWPSYGPCRPAAADAIAAYLDAPG